MTEIEKKRGPVLTIWLIIMLLENANVALTYLGSGFITARISTIPSWAIYILGIGALLNLIFTIYLFMWKKWAFFAFCGMAGIAFIVNMTIGVGIIPAIIGLVIGPVILYSLMKSKWELFE